MTELYFVYGTLTDEQQVAELLPEYQFKRRAVCRGLKRVDGSYPTLVPGDSVEGRLLATPAQARLDRYEGVEQGLYHRVQLPLSPQRPNHTSATVYIARPTKVGLTAETAWPAEAFPECVVSYCETSDVEIITKDE